MEQLLTTSIEYLLEVGLTTLSQMFILLGPGLLLAFLMYYVSEALRNQSVPVVGYKFWIYFTALGTVIHEIGHAAFAVLFGHRLTQVKLFSPDPATGTLGSVNHAYNPKNIYHVIGNFFIGIGPIILGAVVIYFSSIFLMGAGLFRPFSDLALNASSLSSLEGTWVFAEKVYSNSLQMFSSLFKAQNLVDWKFYIFLYIIFAVGAHLKLSVLDLKSAWKGFTALVGLVFIINLVTLWSGDFATKYVDLISQTYSFFYAIMIFTMVLSFLFILVFMVLGGIKRLLK